MFRIIMLIRFLTLLAALAPLTFADVEFVTPDAGASVAGGGKTLTVEWKESGEKPPISSLTTYTIFLCAGGNDAANQIQIAFGGQGSFETGNKASATVPATFGGSAANAYFLKIISVAPGGTVTNYSPRFTLTGMNGAFPPNVKAAIEKVSGTKGPPTENNILANDKPATASIPPGSYAIPFFEQSGLTFYAPMQKSPGTKITAKTISPPFPTSSVKIATTYLPTPTQVTTLTLSVTYSTKSRAHTASPAAMPKNDIQKYLARWRD